MESEITWRDLWGKAATIGHTMLKAWSLAQVDRALLCYAPGPAFFAAFWACLRTGIVAVPVYPPEPSPRKLGAGLEKLNLVRVACGAAHCLADSTVNNLRLATRILHTWPAELTWHATDSMDQEGIDHSLPDTTIEAGSLAALYRTDFPQICQICFCELQECHASCREKSCCVRFPHVSKIQSWEIANRMRETRNRGAHKPWSPTPTRQVQNKFLGRGR